MDATTAQSRDKRMTTAFKDPAETKLQTTNTSDMRTLQSETKLTRPLTDSTDVMWIAYGHSNSADMNGTRAKENAQCGN